MTAKVEDTIYGPAYNRGFKHAVVRLLNVELTDDEIRAEIHATHREADKACKVYDYSLAGYLYGQAAYMVAVVKRREELR